MLLTDAGGASIEQSGCWPSTVERTMIGTSKQDIADNCIEQKS